jgi:hypothetical protein
LAQARSTHQGPDKSSEDLKKLDVIIENFKKIIAPIPVNGGDGPLLLVIHTMTHAATIQRHSQFCLESDVSRTRSLSAATAIVTLLRQSEVREFKYVDPIMGVRKSNRPGTRGANLPV